MDRIPFKRKADFENGDSRKAAKTDPPSGGSSKMSFAQRMMAKMGYKEGEGLGKSGDGMLNPIEVKMRPQGVGVGAVREKTEQAKQEARRQAEKRGEQYEDSSEEERKARRKRQAAAKSGSASGTSTPGIWSLVQAARICEQDSMVTAGFHITDNKPGLSKPKIKYRTAAEFEAAADGLRVPNVLKSIIDATGKEHKTLTTLSGLMTPSRETPPAETEAEKLAKRARRDLESFTDAWNEAKARKKFTAMEDQQLKEEVEEDEKELAALDEALEAVEALEQLDLNANSLHGDSTSQWEAVISRLEQLESHHGGVLENTLSKLAVSAIQPLFKREMASWNPLEEPDHLVSYLERLRPLLAINRDETALTKGYDDFDAVPAPKSTTPYESLIYTLWLPKVRSTITNDWNPHHPSSLIPLLEAWKPLLPPFILSSLTDDLIVKKLSKAVNEWNPRLSLKKKHATPQLHLWVFPWLPHLDAHHLDPKSSSGLMADVKRKFRMVLDSWDLSRGAIPGLDAWRDVLGPTLRDSLIAHLLPRLAALLDAEFEVNPADQNTEPLEAVLAWRGFFAPTVLARLLVVKVFPKWLVILHSWLSGEPIYDEISQWIMWWKAQIPEDVNHLSVVEEQWNKGYALVNEALDIRERGGRADTLPMPDLRSATALGETDGWTARATEEPVTKPKRVDKEITFKDVVEEWCEQEDLMLVPLREAHPVTGLPLFRITASANGKGGTVVFLKGDVVWARRRGGKDQFDPIGLGQDLIDKAEAR